MKKQILTPPGQKDVAGSWRFAPGTRIGDTIYVSGQVGLTAAGDVPDDPADELRIAFENLESVLAEGGATLADVAQLFTYHTDLRGHLELFMVAKDRVFPVDFPSWTAIGVTQLAVEGLRFEIGAIAVLGSGS